MSMLIKGARVVSENYDINDNDFYQDIRFLDGTVYNGQVDLLVGGSPCQSFSIIGVYQLLNF